MISGRHLAAVALLLAICLITAASTVGQTPGLDPQSLVGEWSGDVQGPVNVKYLLTISKAEGNRLFGRAQAIGPRGSSEYEIAGSVDGNVFRYQSADKDLSVELMIDGNTMRGTGVRHRAGARGEFALTKRK